MWMSGHERYWDFQLQWPHIVNFVMVVMAINILYTTDIVMNTGHTKSRTLNLGTHLITPYPLGHLDYIIIIYVC